MGFWQLMFFFGSRFMVFKIGVFASLFVVFKKTYFENPEKTMKKLLKNIVCQKTTKKQVLPEECNLSAIDY